VGDETIWQTAQKYAEIASAVIPKGTNPACPQGKAFIVAAETNFPGILSADLSQSGQTFNVTALPSTAFSISPDDQFLSADVLIATLANGGLFVVMQGGTVAPISPQPEWWAVYSKNSKTDPQWTDGHRGALHLWRSYDCGGTWQRLPDIDSASPAIFSGKCGYPGADKNGAPRRGGFDREELYVDPWTGRLFLTTGCMGGGYGSYAKFHAGAVFTSADDGFSWTALPDTLARATPIVMTSTPSGRLYLAHCVFDDVTKGYPATLYWLDPPWTTLEGGVQIFYGTKTDPGSRCDQLADAGTPGSPPFTLSAQVVQARVFPPSLSRIQSNASGDTLRVVFPAVLNWRQVARVVNVFVAPDDSVTAVPAHSIHAEDPAGDVILPAFVETDRFQLKAETSTAILYWLESTATGELFARYALVDNASAWSPAGDLSILGGARDDWTPVGDFLGDYLKGAFFFQDGKLNFLGAWSIVSLQQVRYNIVSRNLPGFTKLPDFNDAIPMQPVPLDLLRSQHPGIVQDAPGGAIVELGEGGPVLPIISPSPSPAAPTPTAPALSPAACTDKARFITDVTIPDDRSISPGEVFTKIWRLRNDGTCPWTEAYRVVFSDGDPMSNNTPLPIPGTVQPGDTVDIGIDMVAPRANGTYRGNYLIHNPQGAAFGVGVSGQTPFYVQIIVGAPSGPSPTAPPPASDAQAPSVSVSHSPPGSSIPTGSTITFTANASDNVGVTRIDIWVTAPGQFPVLAKTCNNTTSCAYTGGPYNSQGNLSYFAIAADAAGHETNSGAQTILIYIVVAALPRGGA
jgi:hypothetical protein